MAPRLIAIFRFYALVFLGVVVSGCTSPVDQKDGQPPFEYEEPTVSAFMAGCISELTVEQCLCVLDRFRAEFSESAYLETRTGNRYREVFGGNAKACGVQRASKSGAPSATTTPLSPDNANSDSTVAGPAATPTAGPTEREATGPEACLQDRLAAAARASDASVPLEEFERIKKACGM